MVLPQNGISIHKRNEAQIHLQHEWTSKTSAKWKKPDTKGHILYDFIYMKYPEQVNPWYRKQIDGCQGLGCVGGRNGEWLLNGYWVSVWDDEKVLDLDSGDGCTALWMYLTPLNHTLQNGKFYVICILPW